MFPLHIEYDKSNHCVPGQNGIWVKGLSSKLSGNYIVVPNFCFLSYRLQILAPATFFCFLTFLNVWHESLLNRQRSIFQIFWRLHCCAKFLFFELETSNFGSSYVFLSPLKWRGRFLPNLTFWTQKWHISGKMQVLLFQNLESTLLCQIFVFWARDFKFWLQPCFFGPVKMAGSDFT